MNRVLYRQPKPGSAGHGQESANFGHPSEISGCCTTFKVQVLWRFVFQNGKNEGAAYLHKKDSSAPKGLAVSAELASVVHEEGFLFAYHQQTKLFHAGHVQRRGILQPSVSSNQESANSLRYGGKSHGTFLFEKKLNFAVGSAGGCFQAAKKYLSNLSPYPVQAVFPRGMLLFAHVGST